MTVRTFITKSLAFAAASGLFVSAAFADDLVIRKGEVIGKPEAKPAAKAPATKTPAAVKAAPKAATKAAPKRKAQIIALRTAAGQSPAEAWDGHFAAWQKGQPKDEAAAARRAGEMQQDIAATAKRLMADKKFAETVALLEAGLRHIPQPWMFDGLILAMQAAGSPSAELERAYMSATDLASGDVNHLLYVAQRMTSAGLDRRAFKLFEEVSLLDPSRTESLSGALAIALRLDDVDFLKRATLAVLSQEWTSGERKVYQDALRASEALVTRLQKEGRAEELAQYRRDRSAALTRDVTVKVSWTGDADIDLSIVEPSGTVCSFREPRTTSGGVILGDTFSRGEQGAAEAYSETYVCPKAFAGMYQVMLRRVWGNVTSGQVKVEITHGGQKAAPVPVDLGDGSNIVRFELPKGRRTEPLAQVRAVNAVRDQAVIGREILAQQLGGAVDPRAVAAAQAARALLGSAGVNPLGAAAAAANGNNLIPVPIPVAQGAVGFRPVITTLPAGANLAANAVISADRRYVRITVLPLFSEIGKVLAFNIITGRITDGNPDFGGGAGGGAGGGGAGNGGPER